MKGLITALGIMVFCSVLGVQAQEVSRERILSGGVLNGKATSLPRPDYPLHLRDQGIGGSVSVDVVIDESGMVTSATAQPRTPKIEKADGTVEDKSDLDPAFVEAAENAARRAMFSPTLLNGVSVKVRGTIIYNFAPQKIETANDHKTINGGVLNGRAVKLPLPGYPAAAKAVKAEGAVNVLVVINESGEVVESEAFSGHPLLREAAVDASRQAKFSTTLLNGQAVRVKGILVYNFVN